MKPYDELKAEMRTIKQQIVEENKNEPIEALNKVNNLYKEFVFTAVVLKDSLSEALKKS